MKSFVSKFFTVLYLLNKMNDEWQAFVT